MPSRWVWFLGGWLIIAGAGGCSRETIAPAAAEPTPRPASETSFPLQPETAGKPATDIASGPTRTLRSNPSPTAPPLPASPSPKLERTRLRPAPDLITQTEIIQEEKMTGRPPEPTPADRGLQKLIDQAKEDLAQRLAIDLGQIELIELEIVTWPDKGLGCPRPGMVYPQVPQDGALIRLGVGKRLYDYHTGGDRPPFLCEQK